MATPNKQMAVVAVVVAFCFSKLVYLLFPTWLEWSGSHPKHSKGVRFAGGPFRGPFRGPCSQAHDASGLHGFLVGQWAESFPNLNLQTRQREGKHGKHREAVSHPKPSENSQRCHTPIDYPKNYMHVFGKNIIFFFVLQIAYLSPSCASLSNWSPGVLAMRENEFMAARGFVSVTLSRLSSEDALILSRRTIPNIPKGVALPEV